MSEPDSSLTERTQSRSSLELLGAYVDNASNHTPRWLNWLFVLVPIATIAGAAYVFNETVEVGRIELRFIGEVFGTIEPTEIPPKVVHGIYGWGLAFVAMCVAGLATTAICLRVIYCQAEGQRTAIFAVATVLGLAVFAAVVSLDYYPKNAISGALFDGTVGHLPSCGPDDETADDVHACFNDAGERVSIGNTGSSIKDILPWGSAVLCMAAVLAFIAAASTIATGRPPKPPSTEHDQSKVASGWSDLRLIVMMTAATLVLSYLTSHLLLNLGAETVAAAEIPADDPNAVTGDSEDAEGGEELEENASPSPHDLTVARYAELQSAAELYWTVITTVALASIYFPVAAILWIRTTPDKRKPDQNPWMAVAKQILTIVSPLLAGLVVNLSELFA